MKRLFRPEIVLATDRAANASFSVLDTQVSADRSADRQSVLHAIEAALTKARMDAEAIEYPVLAYFLDMAIAELKNDERPDQQFLGNNSKKE
jgi:hypothetical protein